MVVVVMVIVAVMVVVVSPNRVSIYKMQED